MDNSHGSMSLSKILAEGRTTWGNAPMDLPHIAAAMGVVYGDIARQARMQIEHGTINETELKKELGNMISSTVRWCDDLGFDPAECVRLSQEAQTHYVSRSADRS